MAASLDGREAYPDLTAKAAALLVSLVDLDALVDGDKRLGWLVIAVASGQSDVAWIAEHLGRWR